MIKINYNSAADLRSFLDEENLGMRKKYGQNFLLNPQTRQALIEALGANKGDEVWEVGPGLGAMTAALLENGLKVKAFEIDTGFIRVLKRIFENEKSFNLIEGDVMKTWRNQEMAPFLLGNLPYNVAAALLADLIENIPAQNRLFNRMVVTVQKEVALRMTAKAGSPDYSSFSVLCASAYRVKPLMLIHPSSFFPQPNVDSMGVLLEKKDSGECPQKSLSKIFYPFVRALFASRRKTVKNNLSAFLAGRKNSAKAEIQDTCAEILAQNGLSGRERAENLEIEVFLSLAKSVENMRI